MHIIELFDRGAHLNPDGVAFVRHDGTGALTYAEAEALTHRVAAALRRDGYGDGTPVAVLSQNAPALFPHVLGTLRAGCAWVALNARSTVGDLAALLGLVEARVLLHSEQLAGVAERLRAAVPTLERVVAIDGGGEQAGGGWLAPEGARVPLPPLDEEAVLGFFGTGGTTGRPKAVAVPHRAVETMVHAFNAHMPEREPVHLVAAPMTHAAGVAIFPVLSVGGTNVVHDGVVPEEILASIERNRVTRLFLPPTAIYALLAHPQVRARDTSSLRWFLYGAAPMSVDKLVEAIDVFGPVMTQTYGQTEPAMIVRVPAPGGPCRGARRRDKRSGSRAAAGPRSSPTWRSWARTGGSCRAASVARSSCAAGCVMEGYHKTRAGRRGCSAANGWHHTGDIGYVDEDGFVYIVDRKKRPDHLRRLQRLPQRGRAGAVGPSARRRTAPSSACRTRSGARRSTRWSSSRPAPRPTPRR